MRKFMILSAATAMLAGCATADKSLYDFDEARESVTVLLMPMDVEMYRNKVGTADVRADWTEAAIENFTNSITSHLEGTGETVKVFEDFEGDMEDVSQLLLLQQHVADAMTTHVVPVFPGGFAGVLPHKKDKEKLTYNLGDGVSVLQEQTGADYAAFLTNRSIVESTGSAIFKLMLGVQTTEFKGTYVTLVDLKSGEVVWLNAETSGGILSSDPRNPDNTTKVINKIMDKGPFTDPDSEE